MAINVTVRDIVNFPGGTPKTITCDIAQIVPAGGMPEGDEQWITSTTTTATASGGAAIENIFKNQMKRGFVRGVQPPTGLFDIAASSGFKVAIDEAIGSGVNLTLTAGNNILPADVAQDIETQIRNEAIIGGGGSKIGNLSYLNAQVRFVNGVFIIESGTVTETFTGTGRSSVVISAPDSGTDSRNALGLDIAVSSIDLASRQIVESPLTADYSTGDTITVGSTAGLNAGDAIMVTDGTLSSTALVSGTLTGGVVQFTTVSGISSGLDNVYATGSIMKKLHEIDTPDPVSAITTIDQLYRFAIDSIVNQIDFSA